jgi:hypothetical protein
VAIQSAKTAAQVARAIANALERRKIPYAIGGAIALGFYAPPRATLDVDVNIFVSPGPAFAKALGALKDSGFVAETDAAILLRQAQEEGQFRGRLEGIRVDVFIPTVPFYKELKRRVRNAVLLGRPIKILSPEDLLVLKLMFFRRKDLADAEAVLRDQGTALDRRKVRDRLVKLVTEEDERVRAWDDLASER